MRADRPPGVDGGGRHPLAGQLRQELGVYMVAANTTYGPGHGGGVFGPDGKAIDLKNSGKPELAIATIPVTP